MFIMVKWQRVKFQPNLPLGENGERVTACKAHRELSKNAAKEGMVLLKNEKNVLPLQKGDKVALFGKGTFDYVKGGGGSGDVTVEYTVNLYDGLKSVDGIYIYEELADFYRKNVEKQYSEHLEPGMTVEPEVSDDLCKSAANYTDTAIISICRFSGENWDRKSKYDKEEESDEQLLNKSKDIFEDGDFYLTHAEKNMVEKVKKYFANIIVVLNVGGMVDTSWFAKDDAIQSVLMAWQGGMEGGKAAAELLCGLGNPSGKLSDTFAASLEDYPSTYNFHESNDYVEYTEDIYVGYRYFETIKDAYDKVNYPFGYGLSYTTFDWNIISADSCGDIVSLKVRVTNTGKAAGKEVIQIYGNTQAPILGKPAKNLLAFEKTRLIEAGETQVITFDIDINKMASYDDLGKIKKSAYVLEKGDYEFYVGNSVRNVRKAEFIYHVEKDRVVSQLSAKIVPTSLPKRMLADGSYEELTITEKYDTDECAIEKTAKEPFDGMTPVVRKVDGTYVFEQCIKRKAHSFMEVADGKITVDEFLAQLSDEEVAHLLGGQPNTGVANTFGIGNMPEYGVPNIMTADGPAGLRIAPECGVNTTAWPCATLLACTWNEALVYQVGEAGAKEVKENNIVVWLTPAINIHRSPLCGRNFEYYSEDPFLAGTLAAAMVRGIQSQHIAATVKHFALNNKETNRKNSDSRVSERAAREIYLKAFEIIVKEANPWAIMTSYNIINGHRASEYKELITDVLRDEWGFKGMVTTDWWTFGEHYKEVKAGNDLKMALGLPERLKEAMKEGVLTRSDMDKCAKRILELILKID